MELVNSTQILRTSFVLYLSLYAAQSTVIVSLTAV